MSKPIITRDDFLQYEDVRVSGIYNMMFPEARQCTSLTREEWGDIMENYSYYAKMYLD